MSSTKRRPVLVLSNSDYNVKTRDIVVAAITSNLTEKDYTVLITSNDLSIGELKVDSHIRVDKIYTLSQDIVAKVFGRVKNHIVEQVKEKINILLDEKESTEF